MTTLSEDIIHPSGIEMCILTGAPVGPGGPRGPIGPCKRGGEESI